MGKICMCVALLLLGVIAKAQEVQIPSDSKVKLQIDGGIYQSDFYAASNGGSYLSAGIGYNLGKNYWLNLTFSKITASGASEKNSLLIDTQTAYHTTMIIPNLSKDWEVANKLSIGTALGGAMLFERFTVPVIHSHNQELLGIEMSNQGDDFNIALFGEVAIKYELFTNFSLFVNAKTYLPLHYNIDSYMIGLGAAIKL